MFLPIVYFLYVSLSHRATPQHATSTFRAMADSRCSRYPETANRTLEDLDAYFDRDSGHKTIIAIGDKVAKQHRRPQEAIDAERRRIEMADDSKVLAAKMDVASHVEEVA